MNTLDFEDLFLEVISELKKKVGGEQLLNWGLMTIKDWVRDEINQDESLTAKQIAKNIRQDWFNEKL